ncbi:MAG TPA: helix-turn-helix domain-containing protein [Pyrinomonadaceae bacterium]
MNLADVQLKELDNSSLTTSERASLRCRAAADLMRGGHYEAACEALGGLWRGIGERPNVEGLDGGAAAEVLQYAGALSGWMGASRQLTGAQEAAKDLLSESAALFESFGETTKAAFARSDLALCYWREGAYDEARVLLARASEELAGADAERRAIVLLRWSTVEAAAGRLHDALGILKQTAAQLSGSEDHALRGSFHNIHAITLRRLGASEPGGDYYDRAIIEYTAAIYHYELTEMDRHAALIENNLAFLLYKLGRYRDAHEHLDRAQSGYTRLRDESGLAQVNETRARVFIEEGQYREAGRAIAAAVRALEQGGEAGRLAEALTAQGVAWARLGNYESSVEVLRRAVEVAEAAGALNGAAAAALTLIEEHGGSFAVSGEELYDFYLRADGLLRGTQEAESLARLRACARVVMKKLGGSRLADAGFSLFDAVHELESKLIGQALEEAGGSVTRAAKILGMHHQTLTSMLQTRHSQLQSKRTPPEKRLKSIIKVVRD